MNKARLAGVLSFALATVLIPLGSKALAADTASRQASSTIVQRDGTSVSGTLRDAAGRPLAGVSLDLVAWPSQTVLRGLRVGQTVSLTEMSLTRTGTDGTFAFPVSERALVADRRLPSEDSVENFEVLSGDSSVGVVPFSFSVPRCASSAGPRSGSGRSQTWSALDLRTDPSLVRRGNGRTAQPDAVGPCASTLVTSWGPIFANVAGVYVATGQVTGSFSYTAGATSELGVGVSASGAYGSFSASGSSGASSTLTQSYPTTPALTNRYMQANFLWGKFHVAGSDVTRDTSSTASTIVGGALTGGILGISLSAQTGFSSSASLGFHFILSGSLCGANGYPGHTPGVLVARP
jgi:hypothetical protein